MIDFDSDDDQMRDAWETAFGLDATVADGALDPDGDGLTNLQEHEAGTHPRGVFKRYLAEGAVNAFFTTRLAIANPNAQPAAVSLRFLGTSGLQSSIVEVARANERRTLILTPLTNIPENDFSTLIESDQPVVVDRTMTWDATTYGGHAETALEAPATTWYFAEGATHGAFSLFYLLQNPNDTDANVTVNYLRLAPSAPWSRQLHRPGELAPDDPGGRGRAGARGDGCRGADRLDRADHRRAGDVFDRTGQPPFAAGHGGAGVTATALKWFLAEGATGGFFDLYVLVANPNPAASTLKVTYLFPSGEPLVKNYTAGANNRLTISVDTEDPRLENTPVSIIVESTNNQPVVVERAMWWPSPNWYEAHLSAGTTATGTKWALAEGENGSAMETYILIANTGATDGTATLSFLRQGSLSAASPPIQITVPLSANSRTNVRPSEVLGLNGAVRDDRGKQRCADRRRTGHVPDHQRRDLVGRHQRRRDQASVAGAALVQRDQQFGADQHDCTRQRTGRTATSLKIALSISVAEHKREHEVERGALVDRPLARQAQQRHQEDEGGAARGSLILSGSMMRDHSDRSRWSTEDHRCARRPAALRGRRDPSSSRAPSPRPRPRASPARPIPSSAR